MKLLKRHSILWVIAKAMLVMIVCLFYSIKTNGITDDVFFVPLFYNCFGDDVTGFYVIEKNLLETGDILTNYRLGAPFISELYDYPMFLTFNFDILVLRFILLFYPNVFIALNLYYLALPAFIGLTTFLVLRSSFHTPDWLNMGGAITYAFLPFYYIRTMLHFALTTYQFVPLAIMICVWGYQKKIFTSFSLKNLIGNYRNWLTFCICLLIANNGNGYWQAFSCFFILMTGFLAFYDTKRWRSAISCFIPVALIIVFFVISLYPSIHYQMIYGRNNEAVKRNVIESDVYGLKISQMLLPYEIPGNTHIEENFKDYLDTAPLSNENRSAYLGFISSIGFLLLLQRLLTKRNLLELSNYDTLLDLFARLNFSTLLLATIGGFGTIAAVIIGPGLLLRGYNRISVYIAFLTVSAVCLYAKKMIDSTDGWKARFCQMGMCVLLIIHFVLLYSGFRFQPEYEVLQKQYQSDKQFVSTIEAMLPEKAMVYQLPYHKFPEAGKVNKMKDYQLFTGLLHSNNLRWSYGGMKGRKGDKWHEEIAKLPLSERLKVLALVDFEGIYIERSAYSTIELKKLEDELKTLLQVEPYESNDKRKAFYPMNKYNQAYLARYSIDKKKSVKEALLERDIFPNGTGIYHIEKHNDNYYWQWVDKKAKIEFTNKIDLPEKMVKLTVATGASDSAILVIVVNEKKYIYNITKSGTDIIVPVKFRKGKNIIELSTDGEKVNAPEDRRSMYMRFLNCSIEDIYSSKDLLKLIY